MNFIQKLIIVLVAFALMVWGTGFALRRWLGPDRTRRIFLAVTALGVSTVLALGLAELASRWVFRDISSTGDNASYFALRARQRVLGEMNSAGFREREIGEKSVDGPFRVAVVGDSCTYGQGIALEERFSNRVQQLLEQQGARIEVLNFGRSGAETVDHVAMVNESVLPHEPDYILLQWYVNDAENGDYSGRPRFLRLIPSDRISAILHRRSAFYYLLNQGWMQLQPVLGIGGQPSYREYMRARFQDPRAPASRRADEALLEFVRVCRSAGVGVGIVLFPELGETPGPEYTLGFLHDRVLALCERENVRCLDLRAVFARQESLQSLRVNRFDRHPSAKANDLAAKEIVDFFGEEWRELAGGF